MFYYHVSLRTIILYIDNLKAYINGVKNTPPPLNI